MTSRLTFFQGNGTGRKLTNEGAKAWGKALPGELVEVLDLEPFHHHASA